MLSKEEIFNEFSQGYDCGQVIMRYLSDQLGLSKEDLTRLASPLGGGFFKGDMCGAVSAAYLVLGLKFGPRNSSENEKKEILIEKMKIFDKKFHEKNKSRVCEDLLGANIEKDFEKIQKENTMQKVCPGAVKTSMEILEELLNGWKWDNIFYKSTKTRLCKV